MTRRLPSNGDDQRQGPTRGRVVAVGALTAGAWMAFFVIFLWPAGTGMAGLFAAVVPVGLIAGATLGALSLLDLRAEAAALRRERDRLRAALTEPARPPSERPEARREPPAAPAQPIAATASAPARLTTPGLATPRPQQKALPLGTDTPAPLTLPDLIRALHFPETPDDRAGLRAMQRALRDHKARLVVQAAQDMLTLLSQDGIYMDDLEPDRAPPDLWRRFAAGDRKPEVMAVGGIHDPGALDRCRARLRDNTVWRDAAHHFLRRFDQMLGGLVPDLDDAGLAALAETRSARAFMLVGRAAEVFGPDTARPVSKADDTRLSP